VAIELLAEMPSLLKERHIVHFGEGWPDTFKNKFFRVARPQQIEYTATYIITADDTFDLDFDKPSGGGVDGTYKSLLPVSSSTLYEILIGFKGLPVVYPRYNNSYFGKLEVANVLPDTTDDRLKYLGFYSQLQSPFCSPKLREYTVVEQQPPQLRLFNNMPNDERLVIRFVVNRCKVEKVDERNLNPAEKERARELQYHTVFTW